MEVEDLEVDVWFSSHTSNMPCRPENRLSKYMESTHVRSLISTSARFSSEQHDGYASEAVIGA
jgi:hypothetical protein